MSIFATLTAYPGVFNPPVCREIDQFSRHLLLMGLPKNETDNYGR
jgi:hypothetical protein